MSIMIHTSPVWISDPKPVFKQVCMYSYADITSICVYNMYILYIDVSISSYIYISIMPIKSNHTCQTLPRNQAPV